MKFKRSIIYYAICWFLSYVLFNALTFISPANIKTIGGETFNKYKDAPQCAAFWVPFVIITIAFFMQLICAVLVLLFDKKCKKVINLPVFIVSIVGLACIVLSGSVCMAISYNVAQWLGLALCVTIFILTMIATVVAKAVGDRLGAVDKQIKKETDFIKTITADAGVTAAKAQDDEMKSLCKAIYEAFRYSDPVSDSDLGDVEDKIDSAYKDFDKAVTENNKDAAKEVSNALLILIKERNAKCKALR